MNFYPHHIGDYLTATAHLTWTEDAAYRRLLDLYYSREQAIPADIHKAARLVRATSKIEIAAVETVLSEFFTATDEGWRHGRCDAEIEKARVAAERARVNGKKGGRPKSSGSANPEETGWVISGMPEISKSQAPITNPITNPNGDGNGDLLVADPPEAAEAATKAPRGTRLAVDWALPKAWGEWALSEFPCWTAVVVRLEAAKFRDHWVAKSGKDASKADWLATWRNWCRNAKPTAGVRAASGPAIATAERNAEAKKLLGFGAADEDFRPYDTALITGEIDHA